MKLFLFLLCYIQDHILSISKSQDAWRSSSTNCFHTNGAGPEKGLPLPGHCQRSSKQPHDGTVDLQKKETHQAQLETARDQAKWETSLLSNQLCQDKTISLIFPFQEKTLLCTTLKEQHELLRPNRSFHSCRVQPQTWKHLLKTAHKSARWERSCCLQL